MIWFNEHYIVVIETTLGVNIVYKGLSYKSYSLLALKQCLPAHFTIHCVPFKVSIMSTYHHFQSGILVSEWMQYILRFYTQSSWCLLITKTVLVITEGQLVSITTHNTKGGNALWKSYSINAFLLETRKSYTQWVSSVGWHANNSKSLISLKCVKSFSCFKVWKRCNLLSEKKVVTEDLLYGNMWKIHFFLNQVRLSHSFH